MRSMVGDASFELAYPLHVWFITTVVAEFPMRPIVANCGLLSESVGKSVISVRNSPDDILQ